MADQMLRIAGRNPAGIAKAIKTDAEGNIRIEKVGGRRKFIEKKVTTQPTDPSTMIDIPAKSIIDEFILFVDDPKLQLRWQSRGEGGAWFDERVAFSPTGSSNSPQIGQFRYTHPFLECVVWDEGANQYIFKLSKELLEFPQGALLYVAPIATTKQANFYIGVHYRELGV